MKRILAITIACLMISVVASAANPFAGVSSDTARSELKALLEKTMGDNYTAIEAMLAEGMKALESLKALPSTEVNDKILSAQKEVYYPNFTTILIMYQQERAAYDRLQK
jgi:translation initiation factor 2 alpha subunit (eIF-2alpha)